MKTAKQLEKLEIDQPPKELEWEPGKQHLMLSSKK